MVEVFVTDNTIKGRRKARRLALQALYQWHMSKLDVPEIEAQFVTVNDMSKVDGGYFSKLLRGVVKDNTLLENAFVPMLDRPLAQLNPVELTILRLSGYELFHCPEIPYRVVLDEAILMAREFGSQDGHRYVNGVLNQLAQKVRTVEINLGQ